MADEFGGEIPCCRIRLDRWRGDRQAGGGCKLTGHRSPAALLQKSWRIHHWRASAEAAVKAAVMTEDNAAIVWTARQLGKVIPISPEDIDSLYERYQNVYGQR